MRCWHVVRLRLYGGAFEVLDGGQRHGGGAGRRGAIVGRGQMLAVGVVLVVW